MKRHVVPPENSVCLMAQRLTSLGRKGIPTYHASLSWRREGGSMGVIRILAMLFRVFYGYPANVAAEDLALCHQLTVPQRSVKQPKIHRRDRIFWVWLSRLWSGWQSALLIVQPETVVQWHRQCSRLYWGWKSRKKPGRPRIDRQFQDLIRRMCRENRLWGAPRIQSELALLGHDLAESTVAQYMIRRLQPPSQTWRTFLKNHVGQIAAVDCFTVPTVTFRVLYVFLVLRHERRRAVHFNVMDHPTAPWTAQQIVEAFPENQAPWILLRDRDAIYNPSFADRVEHMGIDEVLTAHRCPWQNPFVEWLIGSIRRECLDHVIVLNETHLQRILVEYLSYYHEARCHLSLARNAPDPRAVEPPSPGRVISIPMVGGLHHRYKRAA